MTKVVHCKKEPYDVYIGPPSKWGNPYTHLPTKNRAEFKVATREEAISMYKLYLLDCIAKGETTKEELLALDGKTLGCWCKPQSCHGDVIVEVIDEIKKGTK